MCHEEMSRGGRWSRTSLPAQDRPDPAFARSTPSRGGLRPPASPSAPACLPEEISSACPVYPFLSAFLANWAWFHLPDFSCVFGDRAVARKLSRRCDIQNRFSRPSIAIRVQTTDIFLRATIRTEVCQVHIVIATCKKHVA